MAPASTSSRTARTTCAIKRSRLRASASSASRSRVSVTSRARPRAPRQRPSGAAKGSAEICTQASVPSARRSQSSVCSMG
jgi:hypothetical protein